ncbi:hypothetical protein ACB092_04G029400 [Castanea dentata]
MKSVSPEQSLLQESLLPCSNKVGVSNFCTLWLMKLILYISSSAATVSLLLPQDVVDGTTVPSLFRDLPNLYQIFLISTVFAFVGAFSSVMNQHKPRVERFFRIIAVASILFALAIVLFATALWLRCGYLNGSGHSKSSHSKVHRQFPMV